MLLQGDAIAELWPLCATEVPDISPSCLPFPLTFHVIVNDEFITVQTTNLFNESYDKEIL